MDKIKEKAGIKCAVGIVLVVSIMAMLISGALAIVFFDMEVYNPGGKERFRNEVINKIAMEYCDEINAYYNAKLYDLEMDENTAYRAWFEEKFSEKNCNMAFVIEPSNENDKKKYPTIKNYECKDYQFADSIQYSYAINNSEVEFTYDITAEEMYEELGVTDKSYYDDGELVEEYYYDGEYIDCYDCSFYTDSVGYEHYIHNYMVSYDLDENPDFVKAYDAFIEKIRKDYTNFEEIEWNYDEEHGRYTIRFDVFNSVEATIKYYVKSEFTAHDNFYSSLILEHMDSVIDATIPVLVISIILTIICVVYLTMAAGHRKGVEGLSLNCFDKIPYDVVFAVVALYIMLGCHTYYWYECSLSWKDLMMLVVPLVTVGIGLIVPLYYTTVARLKVGGLFKNTVIWRILAWFGRVLKTAGKKLSGIIRYLWKNLNVYWKYLGVFCIAVIIELIFVASGSYDGVGVIACVLVNAALAFILAVALINMNKLKKGASEIAGGNTDYEVDTEHMLGEFKKHGENLNSINDGIQMAVEERMKSERMKTELITNVSHDIKTPLTSIISYVDLLSKENIDNENAREYIDVLERQSLRLKKLIQDLIDASKASTGNMPVNLAEMDARVLLEQALGEFAEKLDKKGLKPVVNYHTDNTMVMADGKLLWRTFDNLINNIVKYAQDNTRVYIDLENETVGADDNNGHMARTSMIKVTFKNISREELNVSGDELMERFVRGDSSRNTEGSGLGLSIAKSLMDIQNGKLEIIVDGDLFKVVLLLVRA